MAALDKESNMYQREILRSHFIYIEIVNEGVCNLKLLLAADVGQHAKG